MYVPLENKEKPELISIIKMLSAELDWYVADRSKLLAVPAPPPVSAEAFDALKNTPSAFYPPSPERLKRSEAVSAEHHGGSIYEGSVEDYNNLVRDAMLWRKQKIEPPVSALRKRLAGMVEMWNEEAASPSDIDTYDYSKDAHHARWKAFKYCAEKLAEAIAETPDA